MYYCVFVFLLCLFMFSGTSMSMKSKGFYIDGYDSRNAEENQTTITYRYEKNETLNITCHHEEQRPMKLKWLHNEQIIKGTENQTRQNKLQWHISKSNDKDKLTCQASEDTTGLSEDEKIIVKNINLILKYVGHEITTTFAPQPLEDEMKNTEKETMLEKLMKSRLFWIVAVVVIVVLILAAVLACASKRNHRIKEDKVGLHPAVSSTSVFTTESRTPIILHDKVAEGKVGMHSPVSSASYFNTDSRTLPIPQHTMKIDKVRMYPVSGASFFNTDLRTLPMPQHKMTNDTVGFAASDVSYFNTDPRKPTSAQHKIPEECFYTNYDYNKTQLHGSRQIIDAEYQEPIDSQAYSYVQQQMYSEPEKQFYIEPIPKIMRTTKDTAYVNYNKSNGSANINNKNIGLYENCEEIRDNEFDYYTETS